MPYLGGSVGDQPLNEKRNAYMARGKQADTYTVEGVIEVIARSGKGFKVTGDDNWYNVYKASDLMADVGDEVEFEVEEVTKGGQTFRNVKGTVGDGEGSSAGRATSKPAGRAAPARGGGGRGPAPAPRPAAPQGLEAPYLGRDNYLTKLFPVPKDHPDTAIARAVALKAAIDLSAQDKEVATAEDILELAEVFEAYLTGNEEA